jgi:serine protease Do
MDMEAKNVKGVTVKTVDPSGPAEKAGLKPGDVILSMNGKEVDGRTLRLMTASQKPGTTVNLLIKRDGQDRTISVNLAEFPASLQRASNEDDPSPMPVPRRRPR